MPQTKYTTEKQIEEMRQEIQQEKQKMSGSVTQKRSVRNTAGWILFSVVIMVLVGVIISVNITKSRGEIPSIGGYQLFVIESGSMEPTLNIGTVILMHKPKDSEALKENTIVTFRTPSAEIVTHRIVQVITTEDGERLYQTKGDNPQNSIDPDPLTPERVIGVYIAKVPLT